MSVFSPQRGTIVTADDLHLHTQHWRPSAPRAAVVLVHGYAEHCGRYDGVVSTVLDQNVAVYTYDQRGHGRSGGRRAYVDTFSTYLDDLALVLQTARRDLPDDCPIFLFGHSMGGLIVLTYALDRSSSLQGLMMSAPALEINPDLAPLLRRAAQLLGRLCPLLPTVHSPDDAISRDPAVVEDAKRDPFNYHGRVRARTGAELLRAGAAARARLDDVRLPFLLFHGTADTLTNPRWSRELYERAASPDKTLHLYEGLYHETFHEPERDTVLADLSTWLHHHLP